MNKMTVLRRLASMKSELSRYGVIKLGLFGSTVRGENTGSSDIDILVDFKPEMETLGNYLSVCDLLEGLFRRTKVDVVTLKGLSPYVGDTILSEVVYV